MGIHLIPEQQNKGLGPEAIRLFVNHLHTAYELDRVIHIHEGGDAI